MQVQWCPACRSRVNGTHPNGIAVTCFRWYAFTLLVISSLLRQLYLLVALPFGWWVFDSSFWVAFEGQFSSHPTPFICASWVTYSTRVGVQGQADSPKQREDPGAVFHHGPPVMVVAFAPFSPAG